MLGLLIIIVTRKQREYYFYSLCYINIQFFDINQLKMSINISNSNSQSFARSPQQRKEILRKIITRAQSLRKMFNNMAYRKNKYYI